MIATECTDAEAMCGLLMAACGQAGDVEMATLIKSRMEKTFSRVKVVAIFIAIKTLTSTIVVKSAYNIVSYDTCFHSYLYTFVAH